jgi:hypothetical protein
MDVSNAYVWLTSSSIISGTACSSAAPLDGRFGTWPVHSQPTSAFCEQPPSTRFSFFTMFFFFSSTSSSDTPRAVRTSDNACIKTLSRTCGQTGARVPTSLSFFGTHRQNSNHQTGFSCTHRLKRSKGLTSLPACAVRPVNVMHFDCCTQRLIISIVACVGYSMLRAGESFGVQRRTLQSDVYCVFTSKLFAREVNRADSFSNDLR